MTLNIGLVRNERNGLETEKAIESELARERGGGEKKGGRERDRERGEGGREGERWGNGWSISRKDLPTSHSQINKERRKKTSTQARTRATEEEEK